VLRRDRRLAIAADHACAARMLGAIGWFRTTGVTYVAEEVHLAVP
jgi:hypothetical protein